MRPTTATAETGRDAVGNLSFGLLTSSSAKHSSECNERRHGDGIICRTGRDRMGRETGDYHLCSGRDVKALAVDAACFECVVLVVSDPPHVAVRIAAEKRVTGLRKFVAVAAAPDVRDDGCRYDLHAPQRTLTSQHFAEARHVAQGGREAAAAHGGARRIHAEIAVLLASELRPNPARKHLGE